MADLTNRRGLQSSTVNDRVASNAAVTEVARTTKPPTFVSITIHLYLFLVAFFYKDSLTHGISIIRQFLTRNPVLSPGTDTYLKPSDLFTVLNMLLGTLHLCNSKFGVNSFPLYAPLFVYFSFMAAFDHSAPTSIPKALSIFYRIIERTITAYPSVWERQFLFSWKWSTIMLLMHDAIECSSGGKEASKEKEDLTVSASAWENYNVLNTE